MRLFSFAIFKRSGLSLAGLFIVLLCGFLHAQVSVTTNRYDNGRTGQNTRETVLTPANVNVNSFGRLWSYVVDGQVYGQPLYLPNVTIPGKGTHNVLYVVTEHNSVYALDADSNGGEITTPLWSRSFIDPEAGITPISYLDVDCDSAIVPSIGITSTPVIDSAAGTIFLVAASKENGQFVQRLHALDITTGQERPGSPTIIQATYPGTGDGSVNGQIAFDPLRHLQRAGLLLSQGSIYITWASYCDNDPYHGWIMAYNAQTLQQTAVWMNTPNGGRGGNWMSGTGMAADGGGNVYAVVGNGTFDEGNDNPLDFGSSVLRLSLSGKTLNVVDFFTPYNQAHLSDLDLDLGSSGPLLVPIQKGFYPFELITAGKEGRMYVLNRDQLGHFNANNDSRVPQIVDLGRGLFTNAVYWNNNVYTAASRQNIRAYSFIRGRLSSAPISTSAASFVFPGASLVASSNGPNNGILWALETSIRNRSALHAYDATNLNTEFYNTNQNRARDLPGLPVKFAVPTVANGKVYVGNDSAVSVFGLLSSITPTPAISPWGGTYDAPQTVTITDDRQDATIYYTTDGTTPTEASPIYTGPFAVQTSTVVKAIATAPKAGPSGVRVAVFTIVGGGGGTVNYSAGFQKGGLNLLGSAKIVGSRLRLTDGGSGQFAAAWYPNKVSVTAFTQDFQIQLTDPAADGMTFIIQNSSPYALGYGGGYLGYSPIKPSAAIKFDIFDTAGEGPNSTGLFTGGNIPTIPSVDLAGTPINLHNEHIYAVHMTYDGSVLKMQMTDTETNLSFSTQWTVDIPAAVAGSTAYIGFGAGTGAISATQDVLNWTFVAGGTTPTPAVSPWGGTYDTAQTVTLSDDRPDAVIHYTIDGSTPTKNSPIYTAPFSVQTSTVVKAIGISPNLSPSSVRVATFTIVSGGGGTVNYGTGLQQSGLNILGSAKLVGSRLRLTDGGPGESGAGWYQNRVNVQSFTQDFLIQLTSPITDGMTFIIQNASATALGYGGGYLGYSPITPSAAVKFDIFDNAGEGPNSTGLYTGGVIPTLPAVNLQGTGIDLHSQHILAVHMTYNGTTLAMQITDTETNQTFSTQWTIDIPSAVGGTSAWVGFGGGSGGGGAVQDVLAWTLVSQGGSLGSTTTLNRISAPRR